VVQRLNPVTLPLVWLWSLLLPVKYWRSEYLSPRWLARFEVLDPAEHFSVEEWHRTLEQAFLAFRPQAAKQQPKGEFALSLRQWQAVEFEERFLFDELVRRCAPGARRTRRGFALLDTLWLGVVALGKTLKQAQSLVRSSACAGDAPCPLFWTGISAAEVAVADQRLSFSFAVERGFVPPSECLFFLAQPPPAAGAERLRRLGVRWTTVSAFGFLPLTAKLRALLALLGVALRGLLASVKGPAGFVLWRMRAESVPWLAAARAFRCRTYLTSVSNAWPEPPPVEALGSAGVRTVNWSYGANTFCFSVADPSFRDVGLLRSVSSAAEVWVWNEGVERWLQARSLGPLPAIRLIGPVMSGDARWLGRTPRAARAAYGLRESPESRYVAVFDVPPVTRDVRLAIGHGPSVYAQGMLEQFFKDIERLLEQPEIVLLLKPKRSLKDAQRDFADSMQRILDPASPWCRSGRVVALPHDIDPYIPVALADVCVGVPFTSPVVAGIESGRGGIFHDPLGELVHVPGGSALLPHVSHRFDGLCQRIEPLLRRQAESQSWIDPTEVFATLFPPKASPAIRPSIKR
jgi:hypothetical protein